MKKILSSLIIISLLITFSYAFEIFGVSFPASKYGGNVVLFPATPSFYGFSGYFEVGLPIEGVEGLYILGGPRATYVLFPGYGSLFSGGIGLDAIYLLKQWSFNLFGRTWYPSLNAYLNIDFFRVGEYYYSESYVDFDIYLGIYTPYGREGSYINIYFWPWPIIIGFSVVNF